MERSGKIRSPSIRKLGKDGTSWTPTESHRRDRLMSQFKKRNKGYAVAISAEYRQGYDEIDWSRGATREELEGILGGKKK